MYFPASLPTPPPLALFSNSHTSLISLTSDHTWAFLSTFLIFLIFPVLPDSFLASSLLQSPATGHHYECERCEKVFQTPKILQAHVRKVHVLPRFRCSDCMRMFKCKNFLRKHRENPPKRCTLAAYRKRLLKKQEFNQVSHSTKHLLFIPSRT